MEHLDEVVEVLDLPLADTVLVERPRPVGVDVVPADEATEQIVGPLGRSPMPVRAVRVESLGPEPRPNTARCTAPHSPLTVAVRAVFDHRTGQKGDAQCYDGDKIGAGRAKNALRPLARLERAGDGVPCAGIGWMRASGRGLGAFSLFCWLLH